MGRRPYRLFPGWVGLAFLPGPATGRGTCLRWHELIALIRATKNPEIPAKKPVTLRNLLARTVFQKIWRPWS